MFSPHCWVLLRVTSSEGACWCANGAVPWMVQLVALVVVSVDDVERCFSHSSVLLRYSGRRNMHSSANTAGIAS